MTQYIETLQEIASQYDAIIFDQWGVLHDGTTPYDGAIAAVNALTGTCRLGVLSNSGKRAAPNADRIASMGFDTDAFDTVMTSGEALWRDIDQGKIKQTRFFPIERSQGDAAGWAEGLDISLTRDVRKADAVLLMGLPDGAELPDWVSRLKGWHARKLPVYCSNPDRKSPRADGLVISPGALAFAFADVGGTSVFYGKPHTAIYKSVEAVLGKGRYLMVGDSLEHDIAGAQSAGWDSLLVQGGLYADAFAASDTDATLSKLVAAQNVAPPTFRIQEVR